MLSSLTVDAAWIAAHLDDPGLRVVEVDVSRGAYDAGHIPGAVFWNAYNDLRDAEYQPVGRAQLEELFARSGIGADTEVVVYGYAASLGFWLLMAHGCARVHLLEGSREQWVESGQRWSTDVPAPTVPAEPLRAADGDILATRQTVLQRLGDRGTVLVDVRSDSEYSGERFWPSGAAEPSGRAGHIPGARSVPIDDLRAENGSLKSRDELQRVFDRAGVTREQTVITYCTIGNRASHAWYALAHVLGYPDVRVYYGSWVDWGKQSDTPIDTGGPTG